MSSSLKNYLKQNQAPAGGLGGGTTTYRTSFLSSNLSTASYGSGQQLGTGTLKQRDVASAKSAVERELLPTKRDISGSAQTIHQ